MAEHKRPLHTILNIASYTKYVGAFLWPATKDPKGTRQPERTRSPLARIHRDAIGPRKKSQRSNGERSKFAWNMKNQKKKKHAPVSEFKFGGG